MVDQLVLIMGDQLVRCKLHITVRRFILTHLSQQLWIIIWIWQTIAKDGAKIEEIENFIDVYCL